MAAPMSPIPIALTVAGSDPSGGAGIQADLKTFHRFAVYGEAVITLLTVQNTTGVSRVETLSPGLVVDQIAAVTSDIPPAAAKTGALGNAAIVRAVARAAAAFRFPLVVDPVMISKHGARLVEDDALRAMTAELLPRAFLLTPNLPEAETLAAASIRNIDGMRRAAEKLRTFGCSNVLIKGGHAAGRPVDVLATAAGVFEFSADRIETPHTHGTGCTYSAAITAGLAQGLALRDAVAQAKRFITEAIRTNPGLGHGSGPVNHWAEIPG
jgi:hydroxymethylpyrimidine/phosphomethylpyrimidine kinase